ncbi:hypothetical protein SAMN04515667_0531 [Formosa sp. Hel1_31_208]|uniref:hypothetical protein n=1 Tax=Formosa sp. Hel1_31_208 TaxID=1798225 RepID=UPI00087CBA2A|nr:hypothetical protein [Formosa sp. Hel1_31_208]SDR74700.1 hypothetical protein SAMN04515667_0531 [Formosa sp. Hel1_31_208]
MSENLPKDKNEEVDLGALFSAIGKFFDKVYGFIANILKGVFSSIIFLIRAVIDNYKVITIVVLTAMLFGYGLQKMKEPVYYSEMLVKPYFESKYQLVTNIDYYNSLLDSENYETLSSVFTINDKEAKTIKSFEIEIGPETENDLVVQYDKYVKSIDSIRAQDISFEDFVDNRDLYSSDLFTIRVESTKRDIFKKLSNGFELTISNNEYSKKKMRIRDSTLAIKRQAYMRDLRKIDTLQMVYLKILSNESEKGAVSVGMEGMFPLTQERTQTREFELFQNELRLRDSISVLDQLKVEENVYYDVLSDFSEIGVKSNDWTKKYILILPALAILVMLLTFFASNAIRFVKNYEA